MVSYLSSICRRFPGVALFSEIYQGQTGPDPYPQELAPYSYNTYMSHRP